MINYNVCDNNMTFNNTEIIKRNTAENDDGMCLSITTFIILCIIIYWRNINLISIGICFQSLEQHF